MGKRELLLVLAFVLIGAVVYQATAPPPRPGERSLSVAGLLDAARRGIRGNRAAAEITTTSTHPLDTEVTELRVVEYLPGSLQITGEDRTDLEATLRVQSHAYDEAEAKQYAGETRLKMDRAAGSLTLRIDYPKPGRQQPFLTLRIPSRLRVRVESRPASLTVANVSAVEALNAGGDATVSRISGRVAVTHRGGRVSIEDIGSLKFTSRGGRASVRNVRGDASLVMEQGGDLDVSGLSGTVDVETRNARVRLEGLEATPGPIRVTSTGGDVTLTGVGAETRVEGRNSEVDITMSRAAPVAIYSRGADIAFTPPPAAYRVDATVVQGRIQPGTVIEALGLEQTTDDGANESRISGSVAGGGAVITLRITRGDLILRSPGR